jgi:ornithine cyclodeaminase/alanine dehydrogenase-like protein (mu-crystallin family)
MLDISSFISRSNHALAYFSPCSGVTRFLLGKIPSILASGFLIDGNLGYPLMIIASTTLTALRTATTSAIAADYLARKNSHVIGIIGNGVESLPHLHAISLIRDIHNAYILTTI